jgi:predicted NBD/HSP70 family sugar kinase
MGDARLPAGCGQKSHSRSGTRLAVLFPIKRQGDQMRVLVVDIGGTNVKALATGQKTPRKFPSGRKMTPKAMVAGVKKLAADWKYDAVAIGYPGRVVAGKIRVEPHNLARGWVGFDFAAAFDCPVRVINDAAMQALGSYQKGLLLFLGLGTGLGAALVADGVVVPMELAHLPYQNGTWEDYLGVRSLKKRGRRKWQQHVELAIARLTDALAPDDIVLGGGNAKKLKKLPKGCRMGSNANAFTGGFRLFEKTSK